MVIVYWLSILGIALNAIFGLLALLRGDVLWVILSLVGIAFGYVGASGTADVAEG